MEVICALIAEKVEVSNTGQMSIYRTYDATYGAAPGSHQLSVAIILRSDPNDYGVTRKMNLRLIDEDARLIVDLVPEDMPAIDIYTSDPPPLPNFLHLLPIGPVVVPLPHHGRYEVEILLDGLKVAYCPLHFLAG